MFPPSTVIKFLFPAFLFFANGAHAQIVGAAFFKQNSALRAPTLAYSLRRVVPGYAGSAIRVRRSSDNGETDIGFVSGALDITGLGTFCGPDSCYVTVWYDQSGGGSHVGQTNAGEQPVIVNAGTIEAQNARPSIAFDGVARYFATAMTFTFRSVNVVARNSLPAAGNYQGILGGPITEPTNGHILNIMSSGAANVLGLALAAYPTSIANGVSSPSGATAPFDTLFTFTGVYGSDVPRTELWVGQISGGGRFWNGHISEVLIYSAPLNGGDIGARQNDQKAYYSTP